MTLKYLIYNLTRKKFLVLFLPQSNSLFLENEKSESQETRQLAKPKLVKSHVKDKIRLTAASLANESGQITLLLNHVFLFIPGEAMKKNSAKKFHKKICGASKFKFIR